MIAKNIYYIPLSTDFMHFFKMHINYLSKSVAANYRTIVPVSTPLTGNCRKILFSIKAAKVVLTGILNMYESKINYFPAFLKDA